MSTLTQPPLPATNRIKESAINHVLSLSADGGTNINEALKNGLQTAIDGKKGETLPDDVQSIIVFLSDGQPTIGVVNESQIKANIKQAYTVTPSVTPTVTVLHPLLH